MGQFDQTYHTYMSNRKIYPKLPAHLDPNGGDLGSSDYSGPLPDIKNVQGDVYLLLPKVCIHVSTSRSLYPDCSLSLPKALCFSLLATRGSSKLTWRTIRRQHRMMFSTICMPYPRRKIRSQDRQMSLMSSSLRLISP